MLNSDQDKDIVVRTGGAPCLLFSGWCTSEILNQSTEESFHVTINAKKARVLLE